MIYNQHVLCLFKYELSMSVLSRGQRQGSSGSDVNEHMGIRTLPLNDPVVSLLYGRSLKEAFLHQLLNGFRHYDRQLRNDLLVLLSLIASNPSAPLIVSPSVLTAVTFVLRSSSRVSVCFRRAASSSISRCSSRSPSVSIGVFHERSFGSVTSNEAL